MTMSKIHPVRDDCKVRLSDGGSKPSKLTVWQKSSMSFQGTDGFTVFDHRGRLVFRVDNYSRSNSSDLLLMDGEGNPLIRLKPKRLSMAKQWTAYAGENNSTAGKLFSMRLQQQASVFGSKSKTEAEVVMGGGSKKSPAGFRVEGAFRRRSCEIVRVVDGQVVAKMTRKRANSKILLGDEVFSLEVSGELEADLVMAFVVALDRICPSFVFPVRFGW